MLYTSTRDSRVHIPAAEAITRGLVPGGGLYVPEELPRVEWKSAGTEPYPATARRVMGPLLPDFTTGELETCCTEAYGRHNFATEDVVGLEDLDRRRFLLELWHGPTAAFKDLALQILPSLLRLAGARSGENRRTAVLVATSGDTGKAALEGFKDAPGFTIIVFFPRGGVSPVQELQMVTTGGANTFVAAVDGNFDACQTGVKEIFDDLPLRESLAGMGYTLSSANSINWGRLCPQIVYYFRAYGMLLQRRALAPGESVDFCVPTGNFGDILAGYYAREMGVPIRKLICASNKNKVLADFFATGTYDTNRPFHRTMSPSMDILLSSNLERFLYHLSGGEDRRIASCYAGLKATGRFSVDTDLKARMDACIRSGWADEPEVLAAIGQLHRDQGVVIDPHTAVGVAVAEKMEEDDTPVVIVSTASPSKFSRHVVQALTGSRTRDEFESLDRLGREFDHPPHRAVEGLRELEIRHRQLLPREKMREWVLEILAQEGR